MEVLRSRAIFSPKKEEAVRTRRYRLSGGRDLGERAVSGAGELNTRHQDRQQVLNPMPSRSSGPG